MQTCICQNRTSFWAYLRLIREFHDHSSIQDLYISAFNCAYKIGKRDSMFEIGQEYLKEFPDGNYVEDVKFFTARYYLDKGDKDTFLAQAEEFIARYNEESRYCPDMVFLMGSMWMDDQNYEDLMHLAPSVEASRKIKRMASYLTTHKISYIPDPYYMGHDGFELVLDLLEEACANLYRTIKDEMTVKA